MKDDDPWSSTARTPSPSTDEDPDEPVNIRSSFLRRDAQLMREIDLSTRYDPAKFTENPFTIAKTNASRQRSVSSEEEEKRKTVETAEKETRIAGKTTVSLRRPSYPVSDDKEVAPKLEDEAAMAKSKSKTKAKTKPKAPPKPANPKPAKKGKPRTKYTGWYDAMGKPVPVNPPKAKNSIVDGIDEVLRNAEESASSKKTSKTNPKNGGGKGMKQNEEIVERVTFGKIPAGAGPGSKFPIVKALEKQRALPIKSSKPPRELSSSSDETLPPLDINALFDNGTEQRQAEKQDMPRIRVTKHPSVESSMPRQGIKEPSTRDVLFNRIRDGLKRQIRPDVILHDTSSMDYSPSPARSADRSFEKLSVMEEETNQTIRRRLDQGQELPQKPIRKRYLSSETLQSRLPPSLDPSGPTAITDRIETPPDDHPFLTITHVSFEKDPMTQYVPPSSSSQLPYSSPLTRRTTFPKSVPALDLYTPSPRHYTGHGQQQVNELEKSAHGFVRPYGDVRDIGSNLEIGPIAGWRHPDSIWEQRFAVPVEDDQFRGYRGSVNPNRREMVLSPSPDDTDDHPHSDMRDCAAEHTMAKNLPNPYRRDHPAAHTKSLNREPFLPQPRRSPAPRERSLAAFNKRSWEESSDSREEPEEQEWGTLDLRPKRRRMDHRAVTVAKTTPKFRLPPKVFQAIPQDFEETLPASAKSSRATWFRPSARVDEQSKAAKNTLKTDKGSTPYAPLGQTQTEHASKTPTFTRPAERRYQEDDEDRSKFHDQILNSISQQGHTRATLRMNEESMYQGTRQDPIQQEDWRDQWKRNPKLSKYAI